MKTLTITITGLTEQDLTEPLGIIVSQIVRDFTSGFDRRETGSYQYEVTGDPEDCDECTVAERERGEGCDDCAQIASGRP